MAMPPLPSMTGGAGGAGGSAHLNGDTSASTAFDSSGMNINYGATLGQTASGGSFGGIPWMPILIGLGVLFAWKKLKG